MRNMKSTLMYVSLFLTACATTYIPPVGVETAKVKVTSGSWICDGSDMKNLKPNEQGYVNIPSGKKITMGVRYSAVGGGGMYTVNYSCNPRISFIPIANASYYQDFQIEAEKCTAFIYREVSTNTIGLDFDPTMAAGNACTK